MTASRRRRPRGRPAAGGRRGGALRRRAAAVAVLAGLMTAPASAAPPPPLERTIRVAAVGDTVMGSLPYGLPPDGGARLFTAVRPLLRGDVVFGNLEGTLASGGRSKCGARPGPNCFAFRMPPAYRRWLRDAGFTVMSVANNHTDDFGPIGRVQTRRNLTAVGIRPTGWPGSIAYLPVAGGEVAVVAFAYDRVSNSMLDIPRARALVAAAATRAPVVIVSVHAGAEGATADRVRPGRETFLGENRGDSLRFAHAVVDAGADAVIGHGPHVMRGVEFHRGRPIAYSLGNFMGYAVFSLTGPKAQSAVLDLELGPDGAFVSGRFRPVVLRGRGVPFPGGTHLARIGFLSRRDFGDAGAGIGQDGAIIPPSAAPAG